MGSRGKNESGTVPDFKNMFANTRKYPCTKKAKMQKMLFSPTGRELLPDSLVARKNIKITYLCVMATPGMGPKE